MPSKKKKSNEEIFLNHAMTDEGFRNALKSGKKDKLSEELNRVGIKIDDKDRQSVLDAITKIDWSSLKHLEETLNGGLHPLN
jgi:hypothetical protein